MTIQFSLTQESPESADTACVVVGVFEDRALSEAAKRIDEKSNGAILSSRSKCASASR